MRIFPPGGTATTISYEDHNNVPIGKDGADLPDDVGARLVESHGFLTKAAASSEDTTEMSRQELFASLRALAVPVHVSNTNDELRVMLRDALAAKDKASEAGGEAQNPAQAPTTDLAARGGNKPSK